MEFHPFDSDGVQVQIGHWGDDFAVWHHTNPDLYAMSKRHRHNTVEVNLVLEGDVGYYMPGGLISVPRHRLVVFWGSIPHQSTFGEEPADFYSLHIPLASFLQWKLPENVTQMVMSGEVLVEESEGMFSADQLYFDRWDKEVNETDPPNIECLSLEACARLHRFSLQVRRHRGLLRRNPDEAEGKAPSTVEQMAFYISTHYQEPISVEDIADHVNLHPKYAIRLFHKKTGITLKSYIIMLRVHHAQLLLITTDQSVLDVAMDAGFGSSSSFYAAFQTSCGCSPNEYRAQFRA